MILTSTLEHHHPTKLLLIFSPRNNISESHTTHIISPLNTIFTTITTNFRPQLRPPSSRPSLSPKRSLDPSRLKIRDSSHRKSPRKSHSGLSLSLSPLTIPRRYDNTDRRNLPPYNLFHSLTCFILLVIVEERASSNLSKSPSCVFVNLERKSAGHGPPSQHQEPLSHSLINLQTLHLPHRDELGIACMRFFVARAQALLHLH